MLHKLKNYFLKHIVILDNYMREVPGYTQPYAFTITLKPTLFKHTAEVQYDMVVVSLKHKLHMITPRYSAVAELTKNANLHIHGVIQYPREMTPNIPKHFKDYFRNDKLFGFVDIKVMDDYDGWYTYITKELQSTYISLNQRPILYDGVDMFPTGMFIMYGIL